MMIIAGQRYGRLRAQRDGSARDSVMCVCDCGNTVFVLGNNLRRGRSTSCGCLRDEKTADRNRQKVKHGHSSTPSREYRSWQAMVGRCTNPKHPKFKDYGGRGITVCQRWRDSFSAFLADMGPRPAGTSIDRVNGLLGYEPGNCRWATPKEQRANRVR